MKYYNRLNNVKIHRKVVEQKSIWSFFDDEAESKEPENWVAVFHKIHRKYLVSNDIVNSGLNEAAENIQIVGHSDSLDGIMFVIWEHQKSLKINPTILDEIRDLKIKEKVEANSREWGWAKNKESKSKVTIGIKRATINGTDIKDVTFFSYDDIESEDK